MTDLRVRDVVAFLAVFGTAAIVDRLLRRAWATTSREGR